MAAPIARVPKAARVMSTCVSTSPTSSLKSSSTPSGMPASKKIVAIDVLFTASEAS